MSRAVYEGRAKVEGIEGILVRIIRKRWLYRMKNKIAVIVDPKAEIRQGISPGSTCGCHPSQRKIWGTRRTGCTYVIGPRSGILLREKDVHAVIENDAW